jgi:NAD-dependent SIR2 family protein deacetylase
MATVASLRGSAHQVLCGKCGEALIAPEWAEYFSEERLILNLWSCARCGNRFETEAFVAADAEPETEYKKALQEFWPSLVVA